MGAGGRVIRCHMNAIAVFCDFISTKILKQVPMMLALSWFAVDVFAGLAGMRSAFTAILMSTSNPPRNT